MTNITQVKAAAIYARISSDLAGEGLGVQRPRDRAYEFSMVT